MGEEKKRSTHGGLTSAVGDLVDVGVNGIVGDVAFSLTRHVDVGCVEVICGQGF